MVIVFAYSVYIEKEFLTIIYDRASIFVRGNVVTKLYRQPLVVMVSLD